MQDSQIFQRFLITPKHAARYLRAVDGGSVSANVQLPSYVLILAEAAGRCNVKGLSKEVMRQP
jgi:hypothetical protein